MPPFAVARTKDSPGIVWVDRVTDEAFRKALLDGVPVALRGKMREALSVLPDKGARAHSEQYFGAELPEIMHRASPLIVWLNKYFGEAYRLNGFCDWLNITGYGNHYAMIKVFASWSEMLKESRPPFVLEKPKLNG